MDQERIGKKIKEIRKKEGLTQEKFAEKYGVTYQAVSKWENGKNIPDIAILKQICEDYEVNLEDLLNGEARKKEKKKNYFLFFIPLLILFFILFFFPKEKDFELKPISASCDNFRLFGTIAYNDNKTSIHISNITYCGEENQTQYQKLNCILYESDGDTKKEVKRITYEEGPITLDNFLKTVNVNIDHYSKSCKMYQENGLHLEIEAYEENGKMMFYKIPLSLEEKCS